MGHGWGRRVGACWAGAAGWLFCACVTAGACVPECQRHWQTSASRRLHRPPLRARQRRGRDEDRAALPSTQPLRAFVTCTLTLPFGHSIAKGIRMCLRQFEHMLVSTKPLRARLAAFHLWWCCTQHTCYTWSCIVEPKHVCEGGVNRASIHHRRRTVGDNKAATNRGEVEDLAKLERVAFTLWQQVPRHEYVDATRQRGLRIDAGDVMLATLKRQAGQFLQDGLAALKPVPLYVMRATVGDGAIGSAILTWNVSRL